MPIVRRQRSRFFKAERNAALLEALNTGKSLRTVAGLFDISHQRVFQIAKAYGAALSAEKRGLAAKQKAYTLHKDGSGSH